MYNSKYKNLFGKSKGVFVCSPLQQVQITGREPRKRVLGKNNLFFPIGARRHLCIPNCKLPQNLLKKYNLVPFAKSNLERVPIFKIKSVPVQLF